MHNPTFCVQRFTRMLTEIEVKCMYVYQNENANSKYLILSTNAVSHYVPLCKIAVGVFPEFRPGDVRDTLSKNASKQ